MPFCIAAEFKLLLSQIQQAAEEQQRITNRAVSHLVVSSRRIGLSVSKELYRYSKFYALCSAVDVGAAGV
jgi:hypothetical protein